MIQKLGSGTMTSEWSLFMPGADSEPAGALTLQSGSVVQIWKDEKP